MLLSSRNGGQAKGIIRARGQANRTRACSIARSKPESKWNKQRVQIRATMGARFADDPTEEVGICVCAGPALASQSTPSHFPAPTAGSRPSCPETAGTRANAWSEGPYGGGIVGVGGGGGSVAVGGGVGVGVGKGVGVGRGGRVGVGGTGVGEGGTGVGVGGTGVAVAGLRVRVGVAVGVGGGSVGTGVGIGVGEGVAITAGRSVAVGGTGVAEGEGVAVAVAVTVGAEVVGGAGMLGGRMRKYSARPVYPRAASVRATNRISPPRAPRRRR